MSPGPLVYNGNGATATANVPGGSTFTLGGTTYTSDPTNPITGTGKLDFVKAAPTAMFGFGNLVPQNRHFTYNLELGAVFQGSARTKLNLTGNACDSTGLNCVNAATDPTVQSNVTAEQTRSTTSFRRSNTILSFRSVSAIGSRSRSSAGKQPYLGSRENKKAPTLKDVGAFVQFNPGSDLRSHAVTRAVSSAQRGLTSVFGMGTGVTLAV